jgi:hypothetical protein
VARRASGHNPPVHEDPPRKDAPDEGVEDPPSGGGGVGYTGRPSKEEPEEGGATRDEDRERPDSPEGRE